MGGTREGALKAAATLKAKDPDYFRKLRSKVKRPTGGKHAANGFDKDPQRARLAGAEGGRKSRRGKQADSSEEEAQLLDTKRQSQDQPDGGSQRRSAGGARSSDQPAGRGGKS